MSCTASWGSFTLGLTRSRHCRSKNSSASLATTQSVWTVGDVGSGEQGLIEHLDPTVDQRGRSVMAADSNTSEYLRRAWNEIRARGPNYDLALDHANKALEAAAQPGVVPQRSTSDARQDHRCPS